MVLAPHFAQSKHSSLGIGLAGLLALCSCSRAVADSTAPEPAPQAGTAQADTSPTPAIPQVSDDPIVQKIVELGHTDSRVQDHLRHLTREIGPRLPSSHNMMEAERWTKGQLESWGLKAWLEHWGDLPVGFDRGPQSGGLVAPEQIAYDFTTPAWSPGAFGPVRGPAVVAPQSTKELKALKGRLEGAWVIHPHHKPGEGPNEKTLRRLEKALAKAGVAGHVVRARDKKGQLVHTGGSSRTKWADLPKEVRVVLRADQHRDLLARLAGGQEVELEFSIDNRLFRGPVPQHNVIADIKGSEKPDEYVIVSGHLDSWDGAEGALDNGTGVATTMEAARLLMAAGARPKRTIRFILWSAEEAGLRGSRGYVEKHKDTLDKVSAVLVHDGGTNYLSGLGVTPEMMEQMQEVFAPVMKLDPKRPFELEPVEAMRGGGSDHGPFVRAGVPGFFWRQSGESNYRCIHHTQLDTFDEVIPEYQRHSAMVVAIAAYNLANLDDLLDRENSKPFGRRDAGVDLDDLTVKKLEKNGKAKKAGWRVGDVVVEVDGKEIKSRWGLYRGVMRGEPRKEVKLKRGKRTVDTVIDFSDDPAEKEKAERRAQREKRFGKDVFPERKDRESRRMAWGDPDTVCAPGKTRKKPVEKKPPPKKK
jgi:hypothetical protein